MPEVKPLPVEWQEFVAEATRAVHDGETALERVLHCALEASDLVGGAIAALDQTDNEADLVALGQTAVVALGQVAERLLAGKPVRLQAAKGALAVVIPPAVMGLGVYAPQVESFKQRHFLPLGRGLKATGERLLSKVVE